MHLRRIASPGERRARRSGRILRRMLDPKRKAEPARTATGTSSVRRKISTWRLALKRARFEAAQAHDEAVLPVAVTVHPDGSAVAHFAGGSDLYYCDLAHLLLGHGLSLADFEDQPTDDYAAG